MTVCKMIVDKVISYKMTTCKKSVDKLTLVKITVDEMIVK
jgi:hypothetical protein